MLGQLTKGQTLFLERLKALKSQVAGETWLSSKTDTKAALNKLRDDAPFMIPGAQGVAAKGLLATAREKWDYWADKGYSWGTIEGRLLDRLDGIRDVIIKGTGVVTAVVTKIVTKEVPRDVIIEKAVIPWKWIIPAGGVLVIGGIALSKAAK